MTQEQIEKTAEWYFDGLLQYGEWNPAYHVDIMKAVKRLAH